MRAIRRTGMAFIAVYALMLQSLLGVHAKAASATHWPLEIAGSFICTDHGAMPLPADGLPSDDASGMDCCLPGCPMFSSALAAPSPVAAPLAIPRQDTAPLTIPSIALPVPIRAGRPGNPRAPPMTGA